MDHGFILTSAAGLATVAQAVTAGQCRVLKVVTGWGLPWADALRAQALRLAPATIVRTVHGDPSTPHPELHPELVVAELAPWYAQRDPARPFLIELGNEPLIRPEITDDRAYAYGYYLNLAITACRRHFPAARLIASAHLVNHPVAVGNVAWGQGRYLELHRELYRRCDYVGIHAYTREQLDQAISLVQTHVGADHPPMYLTECNLNELLDEATRARRLAALLHGADVAGICLYHLDELAGTNPAHFSPAYRLTPAALAAFHAAWNSPPPEPAMPSPFPSPRPRVTNVAMTRPCLTRGRTHGSVAALVIHATAGRFPGDYGWLRQGGDLTDPRKRVSCHYYIDKAGAITQFVADHDTAWHAGASTWGALAVDGSLNARSIGIELENRNTGADPYPPAQLAAAVALARHLVETYQIARVNLVRHLDISPGRKTDPAGFPWAEFVREVYRGR